MNTLEEQGRDPSNLSSMSKDYVITTQKSDLEHTERNQDPASAYGSGIPRVSIKNSYLYRDTKDSVATLVTEMSTEKS